MTITQRQIANALQVSEMTVSRCVHLLGCDNRPLAKFDAWQVFMFAELQATGFQQHVIKDLLAEFRQEALFVFGNPDARAWVIFVSRGEQEFRTSATSAPHLAALLDLFPACLSVPLHSLGDRAHQRLQALKTRKANAA
ncbi:hypothetical protein PDO_2971 [Rhizobium sp. PDO1-076]|uniref:hypothetical protein n=1 Tax=Rhizobium sp. PDO1-076 TaxID=1125979 RepID=UPI00024E2D8E|nr:hypothetical protein [Rhizobium sp. PDO1-076]EHS49764.1 hypothetical protein PDO_2971 [Rhizobium sp. PDO1-076]